ETTRERHAARTGDGEISMVVFDWLSQHHLLTPLIVMLAVLGTLLGGTLYLVHAERKISAYMQNRIGPNRLGWGGMWQPIADGLKIFLKEDIIPKHVDKIFFVLAPAIAAGTALLALAVVPLGPALPPPAAVAIAAPPGAENRDVAVMAAQAELFQARDAWRDRAQMIIAPG